MAGIGFAAPEICNGIDDDGDGQVDELPLLWYPDTDNDTYGDDAEAFLTVSCINPGGAVLAGTDCDDNDDAVFPGASEICNAIDDNCDGQFDEAGCDNNCTRDSDVDSHFLFCDIDERWSDADDWCDDVGYRLASIEDASENAVVWGGLDGGVSSTWWIGLEDVGGWRWTDGTPFVFTNWASGEPDNENCAEIRVGTAQWYDRRCTDQQPFVCKADCVGIVTYTDDDSDGYGDPATAITECSVSGGRVRNALDCDDSDSTLNVYAWFLDNDNDTFGDITQASFACAQPPGYVADPTDCDDTDSTLNPATPWFDDDDDDGFGGALAGTSCTPISGAVRDDTDCDDTDADIHPLATEICNLVPIDENCDGLSDNADPNVDLSTGQDFWPDGDDDGYGAGTPTRACAQPPLHVPNGADCDDTEPLAYPGAPEQCNERDDDCDLVVDNDVQFTDWYADADSDGFGDPANTVYDCTAPDGYVLDATDCDDTNSSVNPDGTEIPDDDIDQDCIGGDERTDPVDIPPTKDDPTVAIATGCACDGGSGSAHSAAGLLAALLCGLAMASRARPPAGAPVPGATCVPRAPRACASARTSSG